MNTLLLGCNNRMINNFISSHQRVDNSKIFVYDDTGKFSSEDPNVVVMPNLRKRFIKQHKITDSNKIFYIQKHNHFSKLLALWYVYEMYEQQDFFYSDDDTIMIKKIDWPINSFLIDPFLKMKYRKCKHDNTGEVYLRRQIDFIDYWCPQMDYNKFSFSGNFTVRIEPDFIVMLLDWLERDFCDMFTVRTLGKKQARSTITAMDDTVFINAYHQRKPWNLIPASSISVYSRPKIDLIKDRNKKIFDKIYLAHYACKDKCEISDTLAQTVKELYEK